MRSILIRLCILIDPNLEILHRSYESCDLQGTFWHFRHTFRKAFSADYRKKVAC